MIAEYFTGLLAKTQHLDSEVFDVQWKFFFRSSANISVHTLFAGSSTFVTKRDERGRGKVVAIHLTDSSAYYSHPNEERTAEAAHQEAEENKCGY